MRALFKGTVSTIENEMRNLAGGSSGGSGSSSGSGGSGGGFGTSNGNGGPSGGVCATCEDSEKTYGLGTNAIIAIAVSLAVVLLLLVICMTRGKRVEKKRLRKRPAKRKKLTPFEEKLKQLRDASAKDDDDNSVNEAELAAASPISGFYDVDFVIRGNVIGGQVKFTFTDVGGRYKIVGSNGDEEGGSTHINEGFVSYDGSSAWWLDSGNEGMNILCFGSFDFNESKFSGEWQASNGMAGEFIRFELSKEAYAAADGNYSGRSMPLFDQLESTIKYDLSKTDE